MEGFHGKWKVMLAVSLAVAFILGAATSSAVWQNSRRLGNSATLKAVGINIYRDASLNQPLSSIDWGVLEPSESKNFTIYIVNVGNVPITLAMYTENWNPPQASQYITLSWDYNGAQIPAKGVIPATLTLTVSSEVAEIYTFNFDIVIVGGG